MSVGRCVLCELGDVSYVRLGDVYYVSWEM